MATIRLSRSMEMKINYLLKPTKARKKYAYRRPIPADLRAFYGGKANHWHLLGTDSKKAINEAEKLTRSYDAEYKHNRSLEGAELKAIQEAAEYRLKLEKQEPVDYEMDGVDFTGNHPDYEKWLNDTEDMYSDYVMTPNGYERRHRDMSPHHEIMFQTFTGQREHSLKKVELWVLSREQKDIKKVTIRKRFKDFAPFTDTTNIKNIKKVHFKHYIEALTDQNLKGNSIKTYANYMIGLLKSYWKHHFNTKPPEWGNGLTFPAQEDPSPKVIEPQHLKEIQASIVKNMPNFKTQQIAGILLGTGCRVNEVAGLLKEDIKLNHPIPYLLITPNSARTIKTKASKRLIPLVGIGIEAIKHALNNAPTSSPYLFPSFIKVTSNGEEVTNSASSIVNKWLKTFSPNYTGHWFRHTLTARAKIYGYSNIDLEKLMGWTNKASGMFDYYGDVSNLPKAKEVLENLNTIEDYPIF